MQHDLQLRADARAFYNDGRVWADAPSFDEAERHRTPQYLEAVQTAQQMRTLDRSYEVEARQLVLV